VKPGDLIEWVYTSDNNVVVTNEEIWSSVMKEYVLIGGAHLLVSHRDGILSWLPLGVRHARLLYASDFLATCGGRMSRHLGCFAHARMI